MDTAIKVMPRIRKSYKIDERAVEALIRAAAKVNMSANRYLENLLFSHGKTVGEIPFDAEPLGETRGGSRKDVDERDRTSPKQEDTDEPS